MKFLKSLLRWNLQIYLMNLWSIWSNLSGQSLQWNVKSEVPVAVESDEGNGDDTIEVNEGCLEKPTSIELRIAIET